ncbi:unnamed protein product [Phytophthora lilii]|uniref:Unnamed protein product n=1 Tax=Phytophthora lilii TaxID=2077276 RepID=A0A9W6WZH9_9STRA|nr:unnamed protein product [Phytophthora lilii]
MTDHLRRSRLAVGCNEPGGLQQHDQMLVEPSIDAQILEAYMQKLHEQYLQTDAVFRVNQERSHSKSEVTWSKAGDTTSMETNECCLTIFNKPAKHGGRRRTCCTARNTEYATLWKTRRTQSLSSS